MARNVKTPLLASLACAVGLGLLTLFALSIAAGRHVDVPLFWQHWRLGSPLMTDLTDAVVAAARAWLGPR